MAGLHTKPIEGRTELDSESSNHLQPFPVTGRKVDTNKRALDTVAVGYFYLDPLLPNVVVVSGDTSVIEVTAHGAKVGDLVRFETTATNVGMYENYIEQIVDANNFKLISPLLNTITAGDIIHILRAVSPRYSADGASLASIVPDSIKFVKDGVITNVTEDTVTPATNDPLPVKLTGITGDINITAGDLNVQLSHTGGSFDSARIGNGTNIMGVNASLEALVHDEDVQTELQTLNAVDFATEAKQDTIITALGDVNTELNTISALDFATEAKQDTQITSLGNLLTELQLKADLTETQPVSMASLPLPTGAATAALQTTGNTSLSTIVTNTGDTNTSVGVTNTNLGAIADAAAGTDTGSFSVIAFLKRAQQRWTSLLALLPASLGQKTMAGSLAVTLASDHSIISVAPAGPNGAPSVGSTTCTAASVVTVAAPSGTPYEVWVQADITNSDNIRFGVAVSPTISSGWQLLPGASIGPIRTDSYDIKIISEVGTQKINYIYTTRT